MPVEQWHLSKAVPVSFVLAILIQTVALIWFVATLSNDVENNKGNIKELQRMDMVLSEETKALQVIVNRQEVTLGRIDENIKMLVKRSK